MSDCLYIEETVQKITLFTTETDIRIFMKESLRIFIADDGNTEYVTSTRNIQPGHIHISVYAKQSVPSLGALCREYMSAYRFNAEYLSTNSYIREDDLYAIQPTMQYLINEYGNNYRICTQPAHQLNRPPGLGHPQTYLTLPPSRESQPRGIRGRFRSRTFSRR